MTASKGNFKQKTKSLFLKFTVIPILILFFLFFIFIVGIFKWKTIYDTNNAMEYIESQMISIYNAYTKEIHQMAESQKVFTFLETNTDRNLIYEDFYNFNNAQKARSVFHLLDYHNNVLLSTGNNDDQVRDDFLNYYVRLIRKNPNQILVDVHETQYSHKRTTILTFGKAVVKDGIVKGYLIYQLYEDDILNLIYTDDADLAVVTDQFNNIIVSTSELVRGKMNKFSPRLINNSHLKINGQTYYLKENNTPNLKVYVLNSTKFSNLLITSYLLYTLFLGLVLYFLVIKLAEKMSSKNAESIDRLLLGVQRLQKGDMNAYVKIETGDEFEILANQYNIMLDNLNELMRKNEELANIKRINEIRLLQSHFNPHFLFNVLETLRYTMLTDLKEAQNIILILSKLLRYSISNNKDYTHLNEDLAYTMDYLKLHKYRFKDRLTYEINISDEIKECLVPKLLLQPIIENAIKYGYKEKMNLNIIIKAKLERDVVKFFIIDNGGGIEPDVLNDITRILQMDKNESNNIGLYNANRRLKILYGDRYGISIISNYGEGTEVQMKLPFTV